MHLSSLSRRRPRAPPVLSGVACGAFARMRVMPEQQEIREALRAAYAGSRVVRVVEDNPPMLTIEDGAGTNRLDLYVYTNEAAGQARLVALLDNLGKGAAGAAVQNLNIALGLDETEGLRL